MAGVIEGPVQRPPLICAVCPTRTRAGLAPRPHVANPGSIVRTAHSLTHTAKGPDHLTRAFISSIQHHVLVQLGVNLINCVINQFVTFRRCHLLGDHVFRGAHGDGNGLVAHFLNSIVLGRGDLIFGGLNAARD